MSEGEMTELVAAKLAQRVTEQQGRIRQLEHAVSSRRGDGAAVLAQAAHSQQSLLSAGSSGTQVGGGGAGCISARACL